MTKFENDRREVAEDYHEEPSKAPDPFLAWVLLGAVAAIALNGTLLWSLVVLMMGGF